MKLLKRLAREARRGNKKAALVGLIIYLIATFAVRPREALLVRLDGDGLRFPVLKQRRNVVRRFGALRETRRYGEAWRKGVAAFIAVIEAHSETPETLDKFYGALSTKLMSVCDKLKLPRLCFSVLRHVAASEFRAAGVSPQMLARALGHKTTRTQSIYGKDVRDAHPREIPESEIVVDLDFDAKKAAKASASPRAPEPDEMQELDPPSTEIPAMVVPPSAPEADVARGTRVEPLAAPQHEEAPRPCPDDSERNHAPDASVAPAPRDPQRARAYRNVRMAAVDEHKLVGTGDEDQFSRGRLNGWALVAAFRDAGRRIGQLGMSLLSGGTAGAASAPLAIAPAPMLEADDEAGQGTRGSATARPAATGTSTARTRGLAAPDSRRDGLTGSAALPSLSPRPMLPRPPLGEPAVDDPRGQTAPTAWVAEAPVPALKTSEPKIGEDDDEDDTPGFPM